MGARHRLGPPTLDPRRPKARLAGFDLEAGTRVTDGKLEVALKSPWPDGTTHLRFTPLELVEKLAALVPRPHANLLVYHGVLAGNARDRARIVAERLGLTRDARAGPASQIPEDLDSHIDPDFDFGP